ncbi:pilus assembly protein PilZ [Sporolactobacillus sp. THM7-4]|nr:pilus assembly protein PilZ [Sporolactobacillus sp. THM7-4]
MVLKVGETLILEQEKGISEKKRYRCRITEIRESTLLIDYPIDEQTGKTPIFQNGTPLVANYILNRQAYRFDCVFERRIPGRIPMMVLAYEGKESLARIQRRNFVRAGANLDIAVHSRNGDFPPFVTLTSDIGGGGALIILPEGTGLKEDQEITVWICLPGNSGENRYVTFNGKVVRVFTDKATNWERASIQFEVRNERERQPVIRFCFEKQLEQRNKSIHFQPDRYHRQ